jgi:ribokinase
MGVDVTVVGSANLDLVLRVARIPAPGETVLAHAREQHIGGKGLNQAVAASRAGAATVFVGAVGDDSAAGLLLSALARHGVDTTGVRRQSGPSGTALVMVADTGENAIVVDPGANSSAVTLSEPQRALIASAAVVLCQLEVPLPLVAAAARAARAGGALVVLNAAPAAQLPQELLGDVDVLVVNEHEALTLAGGGARDAEQAARVLAGSVPDVVVTLGAAGALHLSGSGDLRREPGIPADVVDSTGAGDAFVGVLVAHLATGGQVRDGLARAVAAGSLAVRTLGAVAGLPDRTAVDELLASRAAGGGAGGDEADARTG